MSLYHDVTKLHSLQLAIQSHGIVHKKRFAETSCNYFMFI